MSAHLHACFRAGLDGDRGGGAPGESQAEFERRPQAMARAIVLLMHLRAYLYVVQKIGVFKWQWFPCSLWRFPPEYNN